MTEIDQLTCFGTMFPDSLLSRGKELSKVPPLVATNSYSVCTVGCESLHLRAILERLGDAQNAVSERLRRSISV